MTKMKTHPIKEILANEEMFKDLARMAFNNVDLDCSGQLDHDEIAAVVYQIAKDFGAEIPTKEDIVEVVEHLDLDNSGKICFDEFCVLIKDIFEAIAEDECNCMCNCRKKICECPCVCD